MSLTEMRATIRRLTRPHTVDSIGATRSALPQAVQPAADHTGRQPSQAPESFPAYPPASLAGSRSPAQAAQAAQVAQAAASPEAYAACDELIQQCKIAIRNRDAEAARTIRTQASAAFDTLIPGWYEALMGQFTGFYLDDALMILAKLVIFRTNRIARRRRDYVNLTRIADRVLSIDETFERAVSLIRIEPALSEPARAAALEQLAAFRQIAESALDPAERWECAQPFLNWASTLDYAAAQHLMPLFCYSLR